MLQEPQTITAAVEPVSYPAWVQGIVKDEKGKVLPGAAVRLSGTDQVALTDTEGRFCITVYHKESTLEFSAAGSATFVKKITDPGRPLTIQLATVQAIALEEVEITAWPQVKQMIMGGAAYEVNHPPALRRVPSDHQPGYLMDTRPKVKKTKGFRSILSILFRKHS